LLLADALLLYCLFLKLGEYIGANEFKAAFEKARDANIALLLKAAPKAETAVDAATKALDSLTVSETTTTAAATASESSSTTTATATATATTTAAAESTTTPAPATAEAKTADEPKAESKAEAESS
jgi:hypothetical protein